MARVLLTGASGFVGGAVLARLRQAGHEVVTLGRSVPDGFEAGRHLHADLVEPATLSAHHDALRQVELVAHLGGDIPRAGGAAADDAVRAFGVNVLGTVHLLAALPASLGGFCFTSTVDVYGFPGAQPVGEDHPAQPASYYAASKLAAESLLAVWSLRTGVPVTVLRLSHVYGPGDTSTKAVPNFLRAALRGERPVVRGDGGDLRDFVYLDDAAEAVALALERRAAGRFNIASGTGTSIRELLGAVAGATGCALDPEWLPAVQPPTAIILDVARARAELGWQPRVALADGLRRTVAAAPALSG